MVTSIPQTESAPQLLCDDFIMYTEFQYACIMVEYGYLFLIYHNPNLYKCEF